MNNHQKKIERLLEEKNFAEADCHNFIKAMWNDDRKSDFRVDANSILAVMPRLEKIYQDIRDSVTRQDKEEHGDDDFRELYSYDTVFEQVMRKWATFA